MFAGDPVLEGNASLKWKPWQSQALALKTNTQKQASGVTLEVPKWTPKSKWFFSHMWKEAQKIATRGSLQTRRRTWNNTELDKKSRTLPHLCASVPPILYTACLRETCLRHLKRCSHTVRRLEKTPFSNIGVSLFGTCSESQQEEGGKMGLGRRQCHRIQNVNCLRKQNLVNLLDVPSWHFLYLAE